MPRRVGVGMPTYGNFGSTESQVQRKKFWRPSRTRPPLKRRAEILSPLKRAWYRPANLWLRDLFAVCCDSDSGLCG